jgi:hypothetical protein
MPGHGVVKSDHIWLFLIEMVYKKGIIRFAKILIFIGTDIGVKKGNG